MRRALTLGNPPPFACEPGKVLSADGICVLEDCTTSAEKKRYAGWGLLGLMIGVGMGQALFRQHPVISAVAGLVGGVAWAAQDTVSKCGISAHPEKS